MGYYREHNMYAHLSDAELIAQAEQALYGDRINKQAFPWTAAGTERKVPVAAAAGLAGLVVAAGPEVGLAVAVGGAVSAVYMASKEQHNGESKVDDNANEESAVMASSSSDPIATATSFDPNDYMPGGGLEKTIGNRGGGWGWMNQLFTGDKM